MRWIAMPVIAAVLSCGLWAAPASANKVGNTSKSVPAGRTAAPAKATKAIKVTKALPAARSAKAGPRARPSRVIGKNQVGSPAKRQKARQITAARGKTGKLARRGRIPAVAAVAVPVRETEQVATTAFNDAASERVYDGVLPTAEEKIIMPVLKDENGRAECVQLIKSLMDAPRTMFWKEGRKLKASWDKIQPGTAIATFIKGRYPQKGRGPGNKHAAIFLRATAAGIYVFDQFAGQADAEERFIPWHHPRDMRPSNNATAFSTVRW